MKILVVGGGGREHALAWKIRQSPLVQEVLCAPGNPGTSGLGRNVPLSAEDVPGLAALAEKEKIDLTVVGPEIPLVNGIVDEFSRRRLRIFGPDRAAARLEGSKTFMKEFLSRTGIPTARYRTFTEPGPAKEFARTLGEPLVVKASGPAAGKGAVVCGTLKEAEAWIDRMMVERVFGSSGEEVVVEEFLEGEEASFQVFCDGEHFSPLVPAQDHKAVFDGDRGPNTGGMGAYAPAPVVTPAVREKILSRVIGPTVRGMAEVGSPFRGILYAGLMISNGDPKVLEFNVRMGDPEIQPILVLMESDLVPVLLSCTDGTLDRQTVRWKDKSAVCVVMASAGYPGEYEKKKPIHGLEALGSVPDLFVFHAGTVSENGELLTNGGRVLGVTALGKDIPSAIEHAYRGVRSIGWSGVHFRTDIGKKAFR